MFSRRQVFALPFIFMLFYAVTTSATSLPQKKPPLFINFCADAETPADRQNCAKKRFENAQSILNTQFSELKQFLRGSEHTEKLTEAQNSWITYRNRECTFEADFFDEEMVRRTLELTCLSRLTENRALLLYNLIPKTREKIHTQNSTTIEENNG